MLYREQIYFNLVSRALFPGLGKRGKARWGRGWICLSNVESGQHRGKTSTHYACARLSISGLFFSHTFPTFPFFSIVSPVSLLPPLRVHTRPQSPSFLGHVWNYKIAMATVRSSACQDGDEVLKDREWRCQAQKDSLENLNTQRNINKDSNRYLPKKSEKFWTM